MDSESETESDHESEVEPESQPASASLPPRQSGTKARPRRLRAVHERLMQGAERTVRQGTQGLLGRWADRTSSTTFVGVGERVVIDKRRHPFLLLPPALRTLTGLLVLLVGPVFELVLLFAVFTAMWASIRLQQGLRTTALVTVGAVAGVVLLDILGWGWLAALVLLGGVVEDAADWYSDRLVVTDKRIYRRHGVLTQHAPSISLTAVAYIDPSVPPVGWLLGYGTLRLDSAAQRDAPLSRFDLIADVVPVSHEILRLRSQALPKFPPLPH